MNLINRMAIVVRPKEPYCAWARSLADTSPIDELAPRDLCSVYLVDEKHVEDPQKVVRRHYGEVFVEMLESWYTLEEAWPARRTWKMFQEWFEAEVIEMVFDLSKRQL